MDNRIEEYMDWPRIEGVVYGEEASPRDVMGARITTDGVLIQGFFPNAVKASVETGGRVFQMEKEDEAGYFAVMVPMHMIPAYHFKVEWKEHTDEFADPYVFPNQITEDEEKAFLAGVWYDAYQKLGAHPMTVNGTEGVFFAVWAPNAERVSLVGDFNRWDGRALPMHRMPASGIFELFVPGLPDGTLYKYEIRAKGGQMMLKADPYAFLAEKPAGDASVVHGIDGFTWTDGSWMEQRKRFADRHQPMSILETSLSDWESGDELLDHLVDHGYTHVELHPVMEYLDENTAGYSTSSYFAPSARVGMPESLQQLINSLHEAGIGVLLDWTPAQFPRNEAGLFRFDGTPLYEVADPSMAVHPMWDTMLYNYGSPMGVDFLLSNACYWAEVYHADGLRLDDVDAMLYLDYGRAGSGYKPNIYGTNENLEAIEFLKHLNSILKKRYPGFLVIAQEDGLWPELTGSVEEDRIGFEYKWSGGWTGDLLQYLAVDPILRQNYHDQLTLSMLYAYSEHYILTLGSRDVGSYASFLDRVWGDRTQKEAEVRAAYAYMFLHPGCKMNALDKKAPAGLLQMLTDLNDLYVSHPALYLKDDDYDGFEWIQLLKYHENVLTFLRCGDRPEDTLLCICNFAAVPYERYMTGVPFYGKYKEIFNSNDVRYGGTGDGNPRARAALLSECDERDCSLRVKLPALSVLVFSCTPEEMPVRKPAAVKKPAKAPARKTKKPAVGKKTQKQTK